MATDELTEGLDWPVPEPQSPQGWRLSHSHGAAWLGDDVPRLLLWRWGGFGSSGISRDASEATIFKIVVSFLR